MKKRKDKDRSHSTYPVGYTLRKLVGNAWSQNRPLFLRFAIYTIAAGVYPLLGVALTKLVLDAVTSPGGDRLQALLLIVGCVLGAQILLGYLKTYLQMYTSEELCILRLDYIRDIGEKLMKMDYKYTEDARFADENERALEATSGSYNGIEGIYRHLFNAPAELLTMVAFVVLIGSKSIWILAALIVNILATYFIGRRTHAHMHASHTRMSHAYRRKNYCLRTTHDFGYGKDIRIYNLRNRVLENYRAEIMGYVGVHRMVKNREFALGFLGLATLLVSDIVVYGVLIRDTAAGMPIADFTMYLSAVVALAAVMKSFILKATEIVNFGHYAYDFYEFMERDLGVKGGDVPAVRDDTLEIVFDNVSFKYPRTDRYVLKNLNLTIRKGERLAVVGVNGAGKTTLVKLMTGLFEVSEGEIRVNGVPLGAYSRDALWSMFSVVFQDVNIFAYSVLENVAGRSGGDRERAMDALERAGLGEKIRSLPKGLDQPMLKIIEEDGTEFSGGESQKLAIARALYKNANMVVMDEPTAALDALAEAEIYEHFADLVAGKTAVYISHRLASTKFCDKIALFDGDGLKEYGSHDELMALGGRYHHMFTVQGKYYNTTGGREEAAV